MMTKRQKFNPGQDLADAERAINRFQQCMEHRYLINGDPPDDGMLRLWQHMAHSLGIHLTNLALDLDLELEDRRGHQPLGAGCSCGRANCRKWEP